MRTKTVFFVILMSIGFESCIAYKNELVISGNSNDAIHNAILDFSNTSKLYSRDSVFSIWFSEKYYRMGFNNLADGSEEAVRGTFFPDIVTVSIIASYNRHLLTVAGEIGSKTSMLPTRFVEQNGKLFYWWDKDYPLTKEMLKVLKKYNLLVDEEGGAIRALDFKTNDAQKGVDYYFCRYDFSKYKKITTSIGIGYYEPPLVKCTSQK